jgi:RimJ/RimL family protein N-acetyltransferase
MPDYVPMAVELETERLVLRPWSVTDAEWYRRLLAERDGPAPELGEVRDFLAGAQDRAVTSGIAALPVVRKQERDPIGYCGLVLGRSTLEEPEIAYELFRHVHGRGYATEAATAILGAAIDTGRHRLWATVRSWNTASFRVLEKLRFERRHRTWDDHGELVWNTRELPGLLGQHLNVCDRGVPDSQRDRQPRP